MTAGQGHETVFKQLVCDRLGLHPNEVRYVQGDTDEVFYGEGTGGSRTSTMASAAFLMATDKVIEKAKAIAAFALKIDVADVNFADGVFSSPKTNRTMTIKEIAVDSSNPAKIPAAMEPGLYATAVYKAQVQNFPNGCHICELEIDKETGVVETRALQRGRRRRHRTQSNAAARADSRRRRARRRASADGGHPLRRQRPARHRLVHGLRHAARAQSVRHGSRE